jgi:hypothetical protein
MELNGGMYSLRILIIVVVRLIIYLFYKDNIFIMIYLLLKKFEMQLIILCI